MQDVHALAVKLYGHLGSLSGNDLYNTEVRLSRTRVILDADSIKDAFGHHLVTCGLVRSSVEVIHGLKCRLVPFEDMVPIAEGLFYRQVCSGNQQTPFAFVFLKRRACLACLTSTQVASVFHWLRLGGGRPAVNKRALAPTASSGESGFPLR